jgi:hypothetical protein
LKKLQSLSLTHLNAPPLGDVATRQTTIYCVDSMTDDKNALSLDVALRTALGKKPA